MKPQALKRDLENSKKLLEDTTGRSVSGYRAPNFSIDESVLRLIGRVATGMTRASIPSRRTDGTGRFHQPDGRERYRYPVKIDNHQAKIENSMSFPSVI